MNFQNKMNKQSFIYYFIKLVAINFIILLSFAGFFKNMLYLENVFYAFYASVILTLFYKFVRPILLFFSAIPVLMTFGIIPIILFSGIFVILINASIIMFVSYGLDPYFKVSSFISAIWLSLFISLFSFLINRNSKIKIIKLK